MTIQSFTFEEAAKRLNPAILRRPGIYHVGSADTGKVLYVGQSSILGRRLYAHPRPQSRSRLRFAPKGERLLDTIIELPNGGREAQSIVEQGLILGIGREGNDMGTLRNLDAFEAAAAEEATRKATIKRRRREAGQKAAATRRARTADPATPVPAK